MNHLDGILKLIENEFRTIEANGKFRSKDEVEHVYKLMDIAKDIYCIWQYEEEMEDGYSEASRESYRGGRSNDDYSMARRRSRGGRQSRNDYARNDYNDSYRESNRSYRRGGYSRDDAKEEYVEELREMMQNAPDEGTRQSIQRMIQQMERD